MKAAPAFGTDRQRGAGTNPCLNSNTRVSLTGASKFLTHDIGASRDRLGLGLRTYAFGLTLDDASARVMSEKLDIAYCTAKQPKRVPTRALKAGQSGKKIFGHRLAAAKPVVAHLANAWIPPAINTSAPKIKMPDDTKMDGRSGLSGSGVALSKMQARPAYSRQAATIARIAPTVKNALA